ncbi:MAG TPA: cobyric acid synthase [Myxococcales bacterium]|nr:cobyric acid synthase [Myxococcales bacterium]
MAKQAIMVLGCSSDAGKSFLTAALCRWFARRGERVAPFKAQNMSNNAGVCAEGSEIGRAQVLQALAAGVRPEARMNPVLLKPEADTRSQVVLMGRYDRALTATPWLERRERLWPAIASALDSLLRDFERVILEGAGSPAEPNLMRHDLVNLAVARRAGAACYLVADVDRGGAFAHLLGTWQTIDAADRKLLRGFVLNKFRGDPELLLDAREWLEARTGVPTVAVVPYRRHLLPEEDSFFHRPERQEGRTRVALVLYPYASNLDEFDPLIHEEGVEVVPLERPEDLEGVAAVLLPGSKNTVASLNHLRRSGLAARIVALAKAGVPVLGICGGLQMLGRWIHDPDRVEGRDAEGLGLLDVDTIFAGDKTTRRTRVLSTDCGWVEGYEIHLGHTVADPHVETHLAGGLGFRQGNVAGVYLHGLFENTAYRTHFLRSLGWSGSTTDWEERVQTQLDRVADLIDESGWAKNLG